MCGICGKFEFDRNASVGAPLIRAMLDTIRHRGPDDQGVYLSSQVGFGHARLSIIDLNSGHQPLSNEDGTVWIVFNGEIYNYRELRLSFWRKAIRSKRSPILKSLFICTKNSVRAAFRRTADPVPHTDVRSLQCQFES